MGPTHTSGSRCTVLGCGIPATVHLTLTEDRRCSASYRYCRSHADRFLERYESTIRYWSAAEDPPCGAIFDLSLLMYDEEAQESSFYLHERGGSREFAIRTGLFEFREADRLVRQVQYPRPSTHETMAKIIAGADFQLRYVSISGVDHRVQVYFADLYIQTDQKALTVDARPSDAIVLALHAHAPIVVLEQVLYNLRE